MLVHGTVECTRGISIQRRLSADADYTNIEDAESAHYCGHLHTRDVGTVLGAPALPPPHSEHYSDHSRLANMNLG